MENENSYPVFSIIMPIYNAEKYLKSAINSVIKQTYTNWELILINDASTDNSLQICQQYIKNEKRIRLHNKKINHGLGMARNTGISLAQGKWIFFMDSDDTIKINTLEELSLYSTYDNLDIIVFGFTQNFENSKGHIVKQVKLIPHIKDYELIGNQVIQLDEQKVFPYAWNKIYKTAFLHSYNLSFESTKMIEDFLFNIQAFSKANQVKCISKIYYNYRKPEHITLSSEYMDNFHLLCLRRMQEERQLLVDLKCNSPKNFKILYQIHIKHIFSSLVRVSTIQTLTPKEQLAKIKDILDHPLIHNSLHYNINYLSFKYLFLRKIMFRKWYHYCFFIAKLYGITR
ncbi:glycosyltransferase family 2 protein [Clostridiaceae bacterium]|nr:glycosyltransferase family 2 protein [Clostridiaceae bacterium]